MAMRALLLLASVAAVVLLPGAQAARAGCSPNLAWQDRFPQWSPTGAHFLYLRETVECAPAPNDLVLARPDGTTTRTFHHASSPSWSTDGRQVAFVGDGRIRIASAVGGRVRALGRADALSWGAGGIAFLRGGELWIADPIRQTERPLATGFDLVGPLAWTRTKDVVTVRRARRGDDESAQLVSVGSEGVLRELTPAGGRYDTISVDNAYGILFFAHRPTGGLWRVEALRVTTGDRWPVAFGAQDAFYPSVSPDGTRVAFLRLVAFDDAVLSVASSDGRGASVDIAWDAHRFSPASWSPDGRRL
jgi:hypothetical protein